MTAIFCIQKAVVERDMPIQKALNRGTCKGDHTEVGLDVELVVMAFSFGPNEVLQSVRSSGARSDMHLD